MLYQFKDPEKPTVLLLGPTGISAVNIDGTTIYSVLLVKPGTKLLVLNDKSKVALTNEVNILIIHRDEFINNRLTFYVIT